MASESSKLKPSDTGSGSSDTVTVLATTEPKPPRMKGKILNLVICGVAFVAMFVYLFFAGEADEMGSALSKMNWWFVAIGAGVMVLYWFLEAVSLHLIGVKLQKGFPFSKSFLSAIIGFYFNCITPLATGGQPMQAYYYNRFGMKYGKSVTLLLGRAFIYQLITTLYCAVMLVLRFEYFTTKLSALMVLVVIGFIVNVGIIGALILVAFCRKGVIRLTDKTIDLLHRIFRHARAFRDPENLKRRAESSIDASYDNVHYVMKDPKLLIKVSLVTIAQLTVFFSLSYVIYRGFGFADTDFLTIIACQAFVYMISLFMPTPGATGAAEGSYLAFFGYIYPGSAYVALSTFIWRAYTFYLPVIVGMVVTLVINHDAGLSEMKRVASQKVEAARQKVEITADVTREKVIVTTEVAREKVTDAAEVAREKVVDTAEVAREKVVDTAEVAREKITEKTADGKAAVGKAREGVRGKAHLKKGGDR